MANEVTDREQTPHHTSNYPLPHPPHHHVAVSISTLRKSAAANEWVTTGSQCKDEGQNTFKL